MVEQLGQRNRLEEQSGSAFAGRQETRLLGYP